jgi:hypothetical protein
MSERQWEASPWYRAINMNKYQPFLRAYLPQRGNCLRQGVHARRVEIVNTSASDVPRGRQQGLSFA